MQIAGYRLGFSAVSVLASALILLWGCTAQENREQKPAVVIKKISPPVSPPAVPAASVSQKEIVPAAGTQEVQRADDRKAEAPMPHTDKAIAGAAIEKEPVQSPAEEFPPLYNPVGKIDPFAPLIRERQESAGEKRERVKRIPQTPLEKMDLSQLRLTAIVIGPGGNKALVEEANGKGYIISEGTYIGLHSGIVKEVSRDCVRIEEEVEDIFGKLKRESKELRLQKQPGEF